MRLKAIVLRVKRRLEQDARTGSLFGAHYGSVRVREGVNLTAPILLDMPEAAILGLAGKVRWTGNLNESRLGQNDL